MSTFRRPAAAVGTALGLAALAMVATGCAVTSPSTVLTPYQAADGTNADLGDVKLRNFLVVSEAKGKPGVVVGAVTTGGPSPVPVSFAVLDGSGDAVLGQAQVTVQPGELTKLGSGDAASPLQLDAVPVPPGSVLTLRAQTAAGGADLTMPVLAPENHYSTITPAGEKSSPAPGPSKPGATATATTTS